MTELLFSILLSWFFFFGCELRAEVSAFRRHLKQTVVKAKPMPMPSALAATVYMTMV
jgi:hypothetical protein